MSAESQVLDCSGMQCPMPIVRTSGAVRELESGDELRVLATDAAFEADIRAWASMTGNTIVSFQDGETKEALIKVT